MVLVLALLVFATSACVAAAAAAAADNDAKGEFSETVDVREVEIRFDASVLPPIESIGKRDDADFLVLCDGLEMPRSPEPAALGERPAPIEPVAPVEPVEITLWLDPAFASAPALAAAARLLADAAPAFAGGEVELVVVRPFERRRFAAGDPTPLSTHLRKLALAWDASATPSATAAERARALDRLALDRFERRTAGGTLFVAVDGVAIDAGGLNELARLERGAEPGGSPFASLEQVARLIAASGWTTFAIAARPLPDAESQVRSTREAEKREVGGKSQSVFSVVRFPWQRAVPPARASVALDVALDLRLEPWAHLVHAGSGTLIGEASAVGFDLMRVANRRRLIVRPPEQTPGTLHRLEVRWSGGDGRTLPSSLWLRAGAPPELAAVRLRALAAHDLEPAESTIARFEPGSGGTTPTRVCLPGATASRWVRLSSLAGAAVDGRAEVGPALPLASGEAPCAALCRPISEGAPCARSDRPGDLLLVEDLESGAWAATRLAAP